MFTIAHHHDLIDQINVVEHGILFSVTLSEFEPRARGHERHAPLGPGLSGPLACPETPGETAGDRGDPVLESAPL
ncbi:MAG: hypothetical protein KDK70_38465, partial [Myxococcales bacterium]|nr:hypothetical protein [Myxococcales bacterium]